MWRVALVLALLAAASAELLGEDVEEGRIVNGTEVPEGKYPFMVSIQYKNQHLCGGSILNRNWILTAAHCARSVRQRLLNVRIVTATNSVTSGGRQYRVSNVIVHREFDLDKELEHDIALFQVCPPFLLDGKEASVKLPTQGQQVAENTSVTVIGWGRDKSFGLGQDNLMEVDLEIISDEKCNIAPYNEEKICSHFPGNGKGDCQGDSGGPVFLEDLSQIGIVSYGGICGQNANVYCEVSNYIDWIQERIK